MKHGKLWITVIGAGILMAGLSAGRAAMQSPTMLYLAGQFQVATGHADEGIRLINLAASQRDSGTVHAAEPAGQVEVCAKTKSKTTQVMPVTSTKPSITAVDFAPATKKTKPVVLMAKVDVPLPPFPPAALDAAQTSFDPVAFRHLDEQQRAEIIKARVELQKAQVERMNHIRQNTQAVIDKYAPIPATFNPVDLSNLQQELPSAVGQMAH